MPNTWITDMRHFIDESGGLAPMSGPVLELAVFQGAIVSWASSLAAQHSLRTNVPCRRRPRGRRCATEIEAGIEQDGQYIAWRCPRCGDNGRIHGWQDTRWDRRRICDARFSTG